MILDINWKIINSKDSRVWSTAKHRAADNLVANVTDRRALSSSFIELYKRTRDYYYMGLAKSLLT